MPIYQYKTKLEFLEKSVDLLAMSDIIYEIKKTNKEEGS